MRIPNGYPRFERVPTLIAVLGKSKGVLYEAHRGVMTKTDKLKEEKPRYSDREGFFMHRRGGRTLGSGSVYEHKDEETMRRFSKKAVEAIRKSAGNGHAEDIFLFEPSYAAGGTLRHFPAELKKRIRAVIDGEYVKAHPRELLAFIMRALDRKPPMTAPESVEDGPRAKEARKILARTDLARSTARRGRP